MIKLDQFMRYYAIHFIHKYQNLEFWLHIMNIKKFKRF